MSQENSNVIFAFYIWDHSELAEKEKKIVENLLKKTIFAMYFEFLNNSDFICLMTIAGNIIIFDLRFQLSSVLSKMKNLV